MAERKKTEPYRISIQNNYKKGVVGDLTSSISKYTKTFSTIDMEENNAIKICVYFLNV
jgi:hypothetical protein